MYVNGELTLGENIGDLSGVTMAYRAYINSLNGKEPPVIDGFTGPQRFFIGYAMSRKGKYQEEAVVSRLASDSHSPLKYRVIGPYRNIDAFHEAFGTQEGDGMWLRRRIVCEFGSVAFFSSLPALAAVLAAPMHWSGWPA